MHQTSFGRTALLSHVTSAFSGPKTLVHTNVLEAELIAEVLSGFRYDVDVVDYDDDGAIDYERYELLVGFGIPILNSYAGRRKAIKVVPYLAGMHNYVQNLATLRRLEAVYAKRHVWLLDSGRFVRNDWTSIAAIADAVLALGDDGVRETYMRYTDKPIYMLPSLYYHVHDYREIIAAKDFSQASRHFLWFGGGGLVHKGLDLALEAFAGLPNLHLHVCGPIHAEPDFEACYHRELYELPNIHAYGFIALDSPKLLELLKMCGWVVLSSCAEGGPTSVLNVTGNGGLVPVVTRESTIYTGGFGIPIGDLSPRATRQAILRACEVPPDDLRRRSQESGAYFVAHHSPSRFRESLRDALAEILGETSAEGPRP